MNIRYKKYKFRFKDQFTISKGTKSIQESLIIELEYFGIKGLGEAPYISYYNNPVEEMISLIEKKRIFLEKFSFSDPERYWHYLHHLFHDSPFLVCALDMAGWDIYGKMKRKPLSEIWNLDVSSAPQTDFTIGIDSMEKMIKKIIENPWPVYKIKMGFTGDIEVVKELRNYTNSPFRIDVNGGWTLDEAMHKIEILNKLNVQFIEQPLATHDREGHMVLFNNSPLPVIADESCVSEEDLVKCIDYFHGINIKLTKCSGITPARRMIEKLREAGKLVMLGCMNEGVVGTSAIAQLAPLADFVDMDGPLLLDMDSPFSNATYNYNETAGLGYNFNYD